jgi:hypothetical protein
MFRSGRSMYSVQMLSMLVLCDAPVGEIRELIQEFDNHTHSKLTYALSTEALTRCTEELYGVINPKP